MSICFSDERLPVDWCPRDHDETVGVHVRGDGSDRRITIRITMRKWMVVCVVGAATLTVGAAQAGASEPVVQGCVGSTFSDAAHVLHDSELAPPGFLGQIVSGFAQQPDGQPGQGDGIQLLQAGVVPDSIAVNTCDD
jgi:hypothetical protein